VKGGDWPPGRSEIPDRVSDGRTLQRIGDPLLKLPCQAIMAKVFRNPEPMIAGDGVEWRRAIR